MLSRSITKQTEWKLSILKIENSREGARFLDEFNEQKLLPLPVEGVLKVEETAMIRKLKTGKYRLYSRKKDPKTGKRRNLGTFDTKDAAEKHERAVQYFKRH